MFRLVLRDPLLWLFLTISMLVVVPYVWPLLGPEALESFGALWVDVPLLVLVTATMLLDTCRRGRREERWFWRLSGLAFLSWLIARGVYVAGGEDNLTTSFASDFIYLFLYLFIVMAIEVAPDRTRLRGTSTALRRLTAAGGFVLLGGWFVYFSVLPVLMQPASYDSWVPTALLTLILDAYVSLRMGWSALRARNTLWRRTYGWIAVAFFVWMLVDVLDLAWLRLGLPDIGPGTLADLVWTLPLLVVMAGLLTWRHALPRKEPARVTETEMEPLASEALIEAPKLWQTPLLIYVCVLPAVHLALAATGALEDSLQTARERLLLATMVVLVAVALAYLRRVYLENARLSVACAEAERSLRESHARLEQRVAERTEDLRRDIARRHEVEQDLRTTQARNQALLEAIPDALFWLDADGALQDWRLADHARPLLRGRVESGCSIVDVLVDDVASAVAEARQRLGGSREVARSECQVQVDGNVHHTEVRAVGRPGGQVLVLLSDITERRRTEQAVNRTQKLDSLGVLAGGVAHDFNNLLTGMLGHAQLARTSVPSGSVLDEHLQAVEHSARHAAKLTDTMLAYAGKAATDRRSLDPAQVMKESEAFLRTAVSKKTRLEIELADDLPAIMANRAQFTQVLVNLVSNAGEAVGDRAGTVAVTLDHCEFSADELAAMHAPGSPKPGPMLRLRVVDSGCGMDPETAARIFDPFYSTKVKGRGLGLAAVLGIVVSHQGTILVDSVPDHGTTMTVLLPAAAAIATSDVQRSHAGDAWCGHGTVLVADDEDSVRGLLVQFLKVMGFETIEATDGRQARELFERHQADIRAALIDYAMPEFNGAEVFAHLHSLRPDLPVVLLSGYSERETIAGLADQGLSGFLHKPFDLQELRDTLRQALDSRPTQGARG